jgi:hypothetical protein
MKSRMLLCLLVVVTLTGYAGLADKQFVKYVPTGHEAAGDTIYVPGGTLAGGENAGSLETLINGDTTAQGARKNPNRVYALNQGQFYFQLAPINCNNPTGTLTLAGIPSASGTTKPVIIIVNTGSAHVIINVAATNMVYGSVKCDGIHYQTQEIDGYQNNELFYCGTANQRAQSLTINNCLFEFSNIDLFDCTNEPGAIGGWPYGAKIKITNSYFRNMFFSGQWWGSRVFQCKHPIDTLWIENCTVTTGGLTFLQQNELVDFAYFNHNTIVNNKKYWILSPYYKNLFVTNNIFINQDWVGEDTNVTNSGQDPDKYFESTINLDTCNATNGLVVQGRYYVGDSSHYSPLLALNKLRAYISDNINYYDPLLVNGYYNSSKYKNATLNALPSYLTWSFPNVPYPIENVPGAWMNARTLALFAAYAPPNGGLIEKRTSTADPGTATPGIANASVVDSMAAWNQNQWGDPRFPTVPNITSTKYIYGDYSPTTLPGVIGGVKRDDITSGAAGITKFTDLTENFSQSGHLSAIDGLPIGALIWDDTKLASFNSATDWNITYTKYLTEGGLTGIGTPASGVPSVYALEQNYPNPFNPSTKIEFSLPNASSVDLKVFNVLGQEVATLAHGLFTAGSHAVTFDASRLSTGVYLYKLTAGSFVSTKKMLLVK